MRPEEADDIFKPAEMVDLLLDDDQAAAIPTTTTDTTKKKRTIINPIKMGLKRSSKPKTQSSHAPQTATPMVVTFEEPISMATGSHISPTKKLERPDTDTV